MKRNGKCILEFVALCCLLLVVACTVDKECRQTESVRCVVLFSCDSLVQTDDTTYTVFFTTIDSLTVVGVGLDSVLYDNQKGVNKLSLPLRADTTQTRYLITLNSKQDTLTVNHQNSEYFVSLACGCFVYHELDTAFGSTGLISNSEVLNTTVENVEQDNIRLYVHF